MVKINKLEFVNICETSFTMAEAAAKLKLHFNTFKRYAIKFGCYRTNQGSRGRKSKVPSPLRVPLNDILSGNYPHFQTFKLKCKLLNEGLKQNKCEKCGIDEWQDLPLNMELDHIDGDRSNHRLENLRMLCPNCHSQTSTFRAKNIK